LETLLSQALDAEAANGDDTDNISSVNASDIPGLDAAEKQHNEDELVRDAASAGVPVKLEEIIAVDDALHLMRRIRESRGASRVER
jgi:hypothetical protein